MRILQENPHKKMTGGEKAALLSSLAAIEAASFSDPWSERMFAEALDNPAITLFVLFEDETLVAYAIFVFLPPEAELLNIAVAPTLRRSGAARMLLDYADGILLEKGVSETFLEVRESNTAARALYTSRGFVPVGKRKNYYRYPTEDAIVMMCVRD